MDANQKPSAFGGVGRAFSSRNYRVYFSGHVLSVQGVWIYRSAALWLAQDLTGSTAWLGAVGFAFLVPLFFLGLVGGAISDRFGHRNTAMYASFLGIFVALATAGATVSGLMTPPLLVGLVLIQGTLAAFDMPARQALIPDLVERRNLSAAIAINSTTFNSAAFIGPAIGGVLLTYGGAAAAFATYAITLSWMCLALFRLKLASLAASAGAKGFGSLFADMADGFWYTVRQPEIRLVMLIYLTASMLLRPYVDLLPNVSVEVFDRGQQGFTSLLAAGGFGAFLVAISLALRGRVQGLVRILVGGVVSSAVFLIAFSWSPDFRLALVLLAVTSGLFVAATISSQSLIQNVVDNAYRGRVVSFNVSLIMGLPAFGALIMGWIATFVGVQWTLSGAGVLILVASAFLSGKIIRRTASYEVEPDSAGSAS